MGEGRLFRYVRRPDMPESGNYGQGHEVRVVGDDRLVGFVRRFIEPPERGTNWAVYNSAGDFVAIADQRRTAARFLDRDVQGGSE